jgi:hypothetical protein
MKNLLYIFALLILTISCDTTPNPITEPREYDGDILTQTVVNDTVVEEEIPPKPFEVSGENLYNVLFPNGERYEVLVVSGTTYLRGVTLGNLLIIVLMCIALGVLIGMRIFME